MRVLVLLLALLAVSVSAAPAASAAAPFVCTYDLIESVAACAGLDDAGRACVIVYVGPSTPVRRCFDPDVLEPCLRFALVPLTVCADHEPGAVCVYGEIDGRAFRRCAPTPVAQAEAGPEPACMDRYWEADLGLVHVVSPDSCTYEAHLHPEHVLP